MSKFDVNVGNEIQVEPQVEPQIKAEISDIQKIKYDLSNLQNLIAQLPTLPPNIQQLVSSLVIADDARSVWEASARRHAANVSYYTNLLDQIAERLGSEAYTADDGVLHDSPIRAKLPELVGQLVDELRMRERIYE